MYSNLCMTGGALKVTSCDLCLPVAALINQEYKKVRMSKMHVVGENVSGKVINISSFKSGVHSLHKGEKLIKLRKFGYSLVT